MDPWLDTFARANFARSVDTAHDLKTPLNVAVLNLELLRMRIAKLGAAEADEKVVAYSRSIEVELRRMARIFDSFFLLSTPPPAEGPPVAVEIAALCRSCGEDAGLVINVDDGAVVVTHESRMRQALRLFFEGATHVLREEGRSVAAGREGNRFHVTISGSPQSESAEMGKIFKFYYSDPLGNPDLSLATARLIAETYGGELIAVEERDNVVTLRLSFPLGDQ